MKNLYYTCITALVLMLVISAAMIHALDIRPMPGFPKQTGGGEQLFYDLDDDRINEVIVTGNGKLFVWHVDGTPYLDSPEGIFFSIDKHFQIYSPPAIGDITGDGTPEIVIAADRLYVIDLNGNAILDLDVGGESYAAPVIADIDGDNNKEIIGSGHKMERPKKNFIFIYTIHNGSGTPNAELVSGFPVGNVAGSSPAVADLDPAFHGLELVWGQNDGTVWAVHSDSTFVDGFPLRHGEFASNGSPAIGDVDSDGRPEIVIGTANRILLVMENDGQYKHGWPQQTGKITSSSPAIADINDDGKLEIFVGSTDGDFYGFGANGSQLPGFPQETESQIYSPVIADIDNDGILEVVVGSKNGKLYAWKTTTGEPVDGFPLDLGSPIYSSPIVGTDGNGHTLIGISTADEFHLYDLGPDTYNRDMQPWPMMKHDPQRTGNYHYIPGEQKADTTPPRWENTTGIQDAFQVEDNTVRLYWNKAIDTESEPVKYNIYIAELLAREMPGEIIVDAALPEEKIANVTPELSNLASGYDYECTLTPSIAELKAGTFYRFRVTAEDNESNETHNPDISIDIPVLDFMTVSEINATLISNPSDILDTEIVTEIMGLSYTSSLLAEAVEIGQFIHDVLTLKSLEDIAAVGPDIAGLDPTAFAKTWLKERTTYRLVVGTNPGEDLDRYQVVSPVDSEVENQISKGWPVIARVKVIEKRVFGENHRTIDVLSFHHNPNRFDFLPAGFNQSEYHIYSFDNLTTAR